MEIDKIVLVIRATRLEQNVKRFSSKSQAKFFIKSRGQSFEDYELEDSNYLKAKDLVSHLIPKDIKLQIIDRDFLPNFVFGPKDIVMTLGQDGLVVNTAKYLNGQIILAVNPDPARFDGILLPFLADGVTNAIRAIMDDKFKVKTISMGEVELNDGQKLIAFNDFYIGAKSHISARYTLQFRGKSERHSSSGIIVSTPAGSTGWLSSLFNMAKGIAKFQGVEALGANKKLAWDTKKLMFVVREPFQSKWSGTELVTGEITEIDRLVIESHMGESGIIFSDGMESDFLEFNSGVTAKIGLSEKVTRLLVKN